MTIGIYALYWEEPDLVYIGQSQNIEERFKTHIRKCLIEKHSNYKVQQTFNKLGLPQLVILDICTTSQCNDREIYWTKEFNSIETGLNIVEAGLVGYGANSNHSKYSKFQILKVFSCLLSNKYISQQAIADKCRVHPSLVSSIYNGTIHTWLRDDYPKHYEKLKTIKFIRSKRRSRDIIKVLSPEKHLFELTNISLFAKEHNLDQSALNRLINGKALSHKGWVLP